MRKRAWRLAVAAILSLTWPSMLEAAEMSAVQPTASATPTSSVTSPPAPSMDDLGRMLGYMVLVGCLAFFSYYFLKHGLPLYRNRNSGEKKLTVLEMKSLGNRQFLLVVGYEDQRLLLGVTPGKIDYLCPLDSAQSMPPDFSAMLAKTNKQES